MPWRSRSSAAILSLDRDGDVVGRDLDQDRPRDELLQARPGSSRGTSSRARRRRRRSRCRPRTAPCATATPTTWNGTLAMRTVWPTGSALAPNRLVGDGLAQHDDLGAAVDVLVRQHAPRRAGQLRISKNSGVVPVTSVDQLRSSATTWAVACTRGATKRTSATSARMARRSSQVSVGSDAGARLARRPRSSRPTTR